MVKRSLYIYSARNILPYPKWDITILLSIWQLTLCGLGYQWVTLMTFFSFNKYIKFELWFPSHWCQIKEEQPFFIAIKASKDFLSQVLSYPFLYPFPTIIWFWFWFLTIKQEDMNITNTRYWQVIFISKINLITLIIRVSGCLINPMCLKVILKSVSNICNTWMMKIFKY